MKKIIGVYKITNTATGDFYIGSSKNVKQRWANHKCPSALNKCPNNPLYLDMKKYGLDKFAFEILEEVEPEQLKEKEQQLIKKLKPTYNDRNAKGYDIEKEKESLKKARNKYYNQLCFYNSEKLTLAALAARFRRAGIESPTKEAKKYLIKKESTPIEFYDIYP